MEFLRVTGLAICLEDPIIAELMGLQLAVVHVRQDHCTVPFFGLETTGRLECANIHRLDE